MISSLRVRSLVVIVLMVLTGLRVNGNCWVQAEVNKRAATSETIQFVDTSCVATRGSRRGVPSRRFEILARSGTDGWSVTESMLSYTNSIAIGSRA